MIAILIPHFNNIPGLQITLNSLIIESSLIEIFLIDDGSNDEHDPVRELNKYQELEIHIYKLEKNVGITAALNYGLMKIMKKGRFPFIARLDAGDINVNSRLTKQFDFLRNNKDIGLVGAYVQFIDQKQKNVFVFKPPTFHGQLKEVIHVYNPFIHPSTMFRTEIVSKLGGYPTEYPALEDHAFFMKISKKYKTAVIDEILLRYEINPEGISLRNRSLQTASRLKLFRDNYYFGIYPSYGLLRALITRFLPQRVLTKIKKKVYR